MACRGGLARREEITGADTSNRDSMPVVPFLPDLRILALPLAWIARVRWRYVGYCSVTQKISTPFIDDEGNLTFAAVSSNRTFPGGRKCDSGRMAQALLRVVRAHELQSTRSSVILAAARHDLQTKDRR